MATLPLKARNGVLSFVFSGLNNLTPMQFTQKCIQYSDNYFTRVAIHVWCKKFAQSRESIVEKKQPGRRVVLMSVDRCNDRGSSFSRIDLIDGINA